MAWRVETALLCMRCAQLNFITFAFMAGEYVAYVGAHPGLTGCTVADFVSGPHGLWKWVADWSACYTFHPSFLTLWGAKCACAAPY